MTRMVQCVKLVRELPGLEKPPFPGELGDRIYENVSQQAWDMWVQHQVLLINHYGLVLADPEARSFLAEQMEDFFFGVGAQMPEGWTPEDMPGTGKGGGPPMKGGGPASK
ncbi:MAG: oxidative damage protection protein [Anaerolineae bacterium]|nr:oxidative damage protection protein [Anaerolineae bacterium]